jgi:predicted AlkP superfamily phosphohydrolase/phosphomutase
VPITFPPEKLWGVLLSAMCVPDLRGTQGMFSYYTTRNRDEGEKIGGEVHHVTRHADTIRAELIGPRNPLRAEEGDLRLPFAVTALRPDRATLAIGGVKYELETDVYTDWIKVRFRAGPGVSVDGVCKFLLLSTGPEFGLYVTPINIDPERPAMPVGYPSVYSVYLAKKQGTFATLGLAEDTWALNEGILNDDQFIRQCLDMDNEREAMFLDALDKVPRGLVTCVFDGTDRLQHTFWRDIDPIHPARPDEALLASRNVIDDLYRRMDDLVGKTVEKCRAKGTLLMVISDHGFGPFRTGIDLNRWLEENGYLVVDNLRRGEDHLAGVDWSRTRAFAIGLAGIFINLKDKYDQGIVDPGDEASRLREEIARRLESLTEPLTGESAVKRVYIAGNFYRGPYKDNAPDLIVGYQRGYRVSWEAAIGKTTEDIFHANTKAWSGDHCVDPSLVPGILFCNRPILSDHPRLIDIAPTTLSMFGVDVPDYMDGKALSVGAIEEKTPGAREEALVEVVR